VPIASPQPPPTPPGWYPDPAQPGTVRWWDGIQWGPAQQPVHVGGTDSYAIASLITAVVGIPILPIWLGYRARRNIRESGGLKTGDGLALAGIIIGWVQIAIFVLVLIIVVVAIVATET
jgi:hypothetical protein